MKIHLDKKAIGQRMFDELKKQFGSHLITEELSSDVTYRVMLPFVVSDDELSKTPNLSHIQLVTAGYDQMDLTKLKQHRINLYNAKDVYSDTIAEDILTKIFVLNRNVKNYVKQMKEGAWVRHKNEYELYNTTVGFIGMGSLSNALVKRLEGFDCTFLGYRRSTQKDPKFQEIYTDQNGLDLLLTKSDYVIVTLPLNEETNGLLTKERLMHMKKSALLINVGRGEVIIQDDLIELLETKQIRGAGLDVCYPEPLPRDHILWTLDNVYLTPHNAPSSIHQSKRLQSLIVKNIQAYLTDHPMVNEVKY